MYGTVIGDMEEIGQANRRVPGDSPGILSES